MVTVTVGWRESTSIASVVLPLPRGLPCRLYFFLDELWLAIYPCYRCSSECEPKRMLPCNARCDARLQVACYHYPHFGTSGPVRTSLVWAAPRMDTPLANSCCTFSFGMSFRRLVATVQDHKLVSGLW